MEQKETKELKEKQLFYAIICLFVVIIGTHLNFYVMMDNGGRMPVYTTIFTGKILQDNSYRFLFTDKDKVNESYLADIIPIGKGRTSIGDILQGAGWILFLCFMLWYGILYYKQKSNIFPRPKGRSIL